MKRSILHLYICLYTYTQNVYIGIIQNQGIILHRYHSKPDQEMFNLLKQRHSGTTKNGLDALLQSDGYYKCSCLQNGRLLTCITKEKLIVTRDKKVVCRFIPY